MPPQSRLSPRPPTPSKARIRGVQAVGDLTRTPLLPNRPFGYGGQQGAKSRLLSGRGVARTSKFDIYSLHPDCWATKYQDVKF